MREALSPQSALISLGAVASVTQTFESPLVNFPKRAGFEAKATGIATTAFGGEIMIKQLLGVKSAPPIGTANKRLGQALRMGAIVSGFAIAAVLATPVAAQTPCTSSVQPLFLGGESLYPATTLLPFASGGSINSLVSAIDAANTAFLSQSTAFIGSPPNPEPDQLGGGVWARGIGGQTDFKSTSTSTFSLNGNAAFWQHHLQHDRRN